MAKSKDGKHFASFLPAVSPQAMKAMKAMGVEIRSWHWVKRSDKSLSDLARIANKIVQGWINYYVLVFHRPIGHAAGAGAAMAVRSDIWGKK